MTSCHQADHASNARLPYEYHAFRKKAPYQLDPKNCRQLRTGRELCLMSQYSILAFLRYLHHTSRTQLAVEAPASGLPPAPPQSAPAPEQPTTRPKRPRVSVPEADSAGVERRPKRAKRTNATKAKVQPRPDAKAKSDRRKKERKKKVQAQKREKRAERREQQKELALLQPPVKSMPKTTRMKTAAKDRKRKRRGSDSSYDGA